MLHFASPWMFVLLAVVALVAYRSWQRRPSGAIRFSSAAPLKSSGSSLRQSLLGVPPLLRILALFLFVIALARPQLGFERVRDTGRGVAIQMIVDRSSSMGAAIRYKGANLTRLDAVKRVFEDFVNGAGELPGRPTDLIGMITFARYPDTVCPLTLSHDTLLQLMRNLQMVDTRAEDGTAIGDALALGAARLKTAEESLARQTGGHAAGYEIKSKVIILLTDGENNAGRRTVDQATDLCAEWGVKVYAIAVGDDRMVQTPFGVVTVPKNLGIDDRALRRLAEVTGGVYRLATDADTLLATYEEIDQLEKSEFETVRYLDYRELFGPFALSGLMLLAFETLLSATWLRRIP